MAEPARRIVHLGLGNFHRAHQAVYTRDAGDGWRITGVAHRNPSVVEGLAQQQHRYHVAAIDDDGVRLDPVDVITDGLVLAREPDAVIARIADPATAVVTLTITEAGYRVASDDGSSGHSELDRTSALGILTTGLRARMEHGEPLTVVSCDNLSGNGAVVGGALHQIAERRGDSGLLAYLDTVAFPSTMVDRIVPATTDATVDLVAGLGVTDAIPVPAEPFSQWVIEPWFAGPRPSWERAGAIISDDVAAWETVKVRLLNGSHSLIASLGLLLGRELIADAFADPAVHRAAEALADTYVPTLRIPSGLDVRDYRDALAQRFANRALGHRCAQVATDGSLKLSQRVPDAARWWRSRGQVPGPLALLVAAYLKLQARGGGDGSRPRDPATATLAELGTSHRTDGIELAKAALTENELLGAELGTDDGFVRRVGELTDVLDRHGVSAAVDAATG